MPTVSQESYAAVATTEKKLGWHRLLRNTELMEDVREAAPAGAELLQQEKMRHTRLLVHASTAGPTSSRPTTARLRVVECDPGSDVPS
jgi:hypothetical protein